MAIPGRGVSRLETLDIARFGVASDLTFYIDRLRQTLVQGPTTLQPLVSLTLVQAEQIGVAVQVLDFSGNGLAPYVNVDPTGWTLQFALGYIDSTGAKQQIAYTSTTALTAISGISAQTAWAFNLTFGSNAAGTAITGVYNRPIIAELAWAYSGAPSGYANKVQVAGTLDTGFIGTGLTPPT